MAKKNLEKTDGAEFRQFLDSFDVLLCDCDGVLWNERGPHSGVRDTLAELARIGKTIKFVTNNTLHSISNFHAKICNFHPAAVEDVINPTLAMIAHLKMNDIKKVFISGSTQMKQEFANAGYDVVDITQPNFSEENYFGLIKTIAANRKDEVGAVIIDYDLNLTYAALLKAIVHLHQPGVLFMTGATETKVSIEGVSIPGPGYFKNMLVDLTGRQPTGFGKPDLNLNIYLKQRFGIRDPSRTLFVGDSLEQDMSFASGCGYKKLLVLTGRTKLDTLQSISTPETNPDYYISSLGELHKLISLHK